MAFKGEPQWCVVGDTFPVGCSWGKSIVYRDTTFKKNPDTYDPRYKYIGFIYLINLFVNTKSTIQFKPAHKLI